MRERFEAAYAALFARTIPGAAVEALSFALTLETEVAAAGAARGRRRPASARAARPPPALRCRAPGDVEVPIFRRADLDAGVDRARSLPGRGADDHDRSSPGCSTCGSTAAANLVLERKEAAR